MVHNVLDSVSCLIDLLFIVDSSGSVQKVYDQQKEYLEEILNRIHLDSGAQRVALLQFAGAETQKTEWMYDSFESKVQLMNAFNQVFKKNSILKCASEFKS